MFKRRVVAVVLAGVAVVAVSGTAVAAPVAPQVICRPGCICAC